MVDSTLDHEEPGENELTAESVRALAGPITVVLVDDHEVVRAGVGGWCAAARPPITVISAGERVSVAWTGAGAHADVVVLDLDLDLDRGQDYEQNLRRLIGAGRRVVVFTHHTEQAILTNCITVGALAYVTKAEGPEHLVEAIRKAADNRPHTPPALSGAMLVDTGPNHPQLTPAEIEALRAWFTSSSKVLAARRLNKTEKAVDRLIERARLRYALVGRAAGTQAMLLARALQDGLITLDEMNQFG